MSAFVVFTREQTLDQAELDAYSAAVGESFQGREVSFLAPYGDHEVLEGTSGAQASKWSHHRKNYRGR